MVPIFVLMTFLVVIIAAALFTRFKEKAKAAQVIKSEKNNFALLYPLNYLLFDNHIWFKETSAKSFMLGLDELLHNFMGIPDQIFLKNEGDKIYKGEQLAILKKGDKEIYLQAPVSVVIKKVNDSLTIHPDLIDTNPYDQGWLYTLEILSFNKDNNDFKTGLAANKWLKEEFNRMKEFLKIHSNQYTPAVETLMDGGWPVQGVVDYIDQQTLTLFEQEFLQVEKSITDK